MMTIYVVGDGPRDEATVPPLVGRVLGVTVGAVFSAWKELRLAGGGYEKKLKFAAREAQDRNIAYLVAVVDVDVDGQRDKLRRLREASRNDSVCGTVVQVA